MPKVKVWLFKKKDNENEVETTLRGLKTFEAKRLLSGTERILIKPNWIIAEHHSRGNTTSTETLEGIVKYLIEECNISSANITIGEGEIGRAHV